MDIEVRIPALVSLEHECPCGKKQIDMTYKRALVFWQAEEGAEVRPGDPLCDCEVEKITFSIPSPGHGLLHRLTEEGGECDIHAPLALLRS